jgi:hypothetical protein
MMVISQREVFVTRKMKLFSHVFPIFRHWHAGRPLEHMAYLITGEVKLILCVLFLVAVLGMSVCCTCLPRKVEQVGPVQ